MPMSDRVVGTASNVVVAWFTASGPAAFESLLAVFRSGSVFRHYRAKL